MDEKKAEILPLYYYSKHMYALQREKKTIKCLTYSLYLVAQPQQPRKFIYIGATFDVVTILQQQS